MKKTLSLEDLPDEMLLNVFAGDYLTCQNILNCVTINRFSSRWFDSAEADEDVCKALRITQLLVAAAPR
jgi:hypothetical protein